MAIRALSIRERVKEWKEWKTEKPARMTRACTKKRLKQVGMLRVRGREQHECVQVWKEAKYGEV